MGLLSYFLGMVRGGGALSERGGEQRPVPSATLVPDVSNPGVDGALQISTVWSCIERRASTVASLPFFAYDSNNGQRTVARESRLFALLHETPNSRMTPYEFWRAMMVNHDLRGNAYARIERDSRTGEAVSMWPMPADQVSQYITDENECWYVYRLGSEVFTFPEQDVLHLKGLGNGISGLSKLEFMSATTTEVQAQGTSATKIFGTGGKPTGVLTIDKVLRQDQRDLLKSSLAEMASGSRQRMFVLEADMKYQQLSISPEDQQLLETRRFSVEELCRWFDVPPVLVHHSNVTTWGSGIEQIVDGFHKFTVRPMLVSIEQAVRKRVMTPAQRARMSVEFSLDALLRGNAKDRAEIAAKLVQNGLKTRNEWRQLENDPPLPGGDVLTVQSNLLPMELLGKTQPTGGANAAAQDPIAQ